MRTTGPGTIGSTATNQVLTIVYGSCSGTRRWAFSVDGSTITCQAWGDPWCGYVSAGAEAVSRSGHDIRVHCGNLQTVHNAGWARWSAGYWQSPSPCEDDPPYYVAKNSDRDFSVRTRVGKDAHVVDASLQAMGSWAGIMRVGSHDAAVVHADPIDTSVLSEGVRPHCIYWSDGAHDWEMRAGTPDAGRAIEAARTVAYR